MSYSETVYLETNEHIIIGDIFLKNTGKYNRIISENLNMNKNFLSLTNCQVIYKNNRSVLEHREYIAVNKAQIILVRPYEEDK